MSDLSNIGASISSYYSSDTSSFDVICNNSTDCRNSGTCSANKTCVCINGCWGTHCNFTKENASKASEQNSLILDKFNSMDLNSKNENQTLQIANTIQQITSVKEINSDKTVNQTFDLIEKISNSSTTSAKVAASVVNTVSNILDIVSSGDSSNKKDSQIDKVKNSVDLIINSQLNSNQTEVPITFQSNNIAITAVKLDTSNKTAMAVTLKKVFEDYTLAEKNSTVTSSKIIVSADFIDQLSSVKGASVSKTEWSSNIYSSKDPQTSITSKIVSVNVKDEAKSKVEIKNLSSPVEIQITEKNTTQEGSTCKFFNETTNKWEDKGVQTKKDNLSNSTYKCQSTHLTDFGTSKVVIVAQNNYSGEIWYTINSNYGLWASVIYFFVLLLVYLVVHSMKFNKAYKSIQLQEPNTGALQTDKEVEQHSPDCLTKNHQKIETIINDEQNDFWILMPIYSIIKSNSRDDCSKKIANFGIYVTTISMFLSCLFSSPDYDVNFLLSIKIYNYKNLNR